MRDQKLYDQLVNAFSMRDFLPNSSASALYFPEVTKYPPADGSSSVDKTA